MPPLIGVNRPRRRPRMLDAQEVFPMRIDRVFTAHMIAVNPGDTLQQAAEAMRRHHVGALPVVENAGPRAEVVGIVTDRDLAITAVAEALDVRKVRVDKVMSLVVASAPITADLYEALDRMRAAGVRRLLITADGGAPAGILSLDDIVDGLAAQLASAAALMKRGMQREHAQESVSVRTPE
jgi:CBS domain-containing protein